MVTVLVIVVSDLLGELGRLADENGPEVGVEGGDTGARKRKVVGTVEETLLGLRVGHHRAPLVGEHTCEVLGEWLGLSSDEAEKLVALESS